MTRPYRFRSASFIASALLLAGACDRIQPETQETGVAILALTTAPGDAACLRITARGATVAVRSFALMANQSTNLMLTGLPLGQVVFTAEAFGIACSGVTGETAATYLSDAVSATLVDGQASTVTIALHRPGSANISIDFPDAGLGMCDGTPGQWDGCRGTGCFVCSEKLAEFPRYIQNHPACVKNDTCAGQFFTCNAACPAPTDADRDPMMCNGTPGQWDGCRGTGCFVCSEKLAEFPRYIQNHPACVKNDTCAGQFFTCNAACPAPTDADRDPMMCNGTPGQWDGCRGTGCSVCSEKLAEFPRYFQNHPACVKNDTCAGQFFTCNAACPAPSDADRDPSVTRLFFEAENGMFTAPLTLVTDAAASGGKAIWSATADSLMTVPTSGHAVFPFNLMTPMVVKVWGRFLVGPATMVDDSLWVRIDSGAWIQWNDIFPRIGNAGWAWDNVHNTATSNSQPTFSLTAGNHTLEVAYRESGLKIDRFLVTSDLVNKPL